MRVFCSQKVNIIISFFKSIGEGTLPFVWLFNEISRLACIKYTISTLIMKYLESSDRITEYERIVDIL